MATSAVKMHSAPQVLSRSVVLVGLMGSGKSSVGERLASLLAVPFYDSDAEIVAATGMSIPEIFASVGEKGFRDRERRVIVRLLAGRPAVIATGGGGFLDPDTRAAIRSRAVSVWLRAELDVLWDRVRDRPGRPLLKVSDPRAALADLYRRRAPIYSEANLVVDSQRDSDPLGIARETLKAVQAHASAPPLRARLRRVTAAV